MIDIPEPNPHRIGACEECGAWRADGHAPYLHKRNCLKNNNLQIDRYLNELNETETGSIGGPTIYCDDSTHDHYVSPEFLERIHTSLKIHAQVLRRLANE